MESNLTLLFKEILNKVYVFAIKATTLFFFLLNCELYYTQTNLDSTDLSKEEFLGKQQTGLVTKKVKDSIRAEHLETLSNINCDLSNSWTINIKVNDPDAESYEANAIKSYLFTYKTRKKGRNSGVIMNLYDMKYKDSVELEKKSIHSSVATYFFYTKSYIVYVNHGKNVNSIYDSFMPILLEELKLFFDTNNDRL